MGDTWAWHYICTCRYEASTPGELEWHYEHGNCPFGSEVKT